MSIKQNNLVLDFKTKCLHDLKNKYQHLNSLQSQILACIQSQCEEKIQQISKILVNVEDEVLFYLRQKIKCIFQIEEKKIEEELLCLENQIQSMVQTQKENLIYMIKVLEEQLPGMNRLLGKFASGKIQQQQKIFEMDLFQLKISPQQVFFLVEDITDIFNAKYPKQKIYQKSEFNKLTQNTEEFNGFNPKLCNNCSTQKLSRSKIFLKNQYNISQRIEQKGSLSKNWRNRSQNLNKPAVDLFKQAKADKKMKRVASFLKKQQNQESEMENLIKMALKKKKILKQLQ